MDSQWVGGTKDCSLHLGHMTKMATMPSYGKKNFKNLLRHQRASGPGAWYAAFGTWAQ